MVTKTMKILRPPPPKKNAGTNRNNFLLLNSQIFKIILRPLYDKHTNNQTDK